MKIDDKKTGYSIYAIYAMTADGVEELVEVSQDLKLISGLFNHLIKDIDSGKSKYQEARVES